MLQHLLMLFGFFSLVLALIFWINGAVRLLDWLIADGQSTKVFLEMTVLSLPGLLARLLPIAAFAATVYATNRLSADSELVVVQSAGYSPYRLARPAVIFGLLVTLMLGVLSHVLVPMSKWELRQRQSQIASDVTARLLVEGTFVHPSKNVTFFVRDITPAGELQDVYLSTVSDENIRQSFTATRALIVREDSGPLLLMFDGMSQVYSGEENRLAVTRFDSFAYSLANYIAPPEAPNQEIRTTSSLALLSGNSPVQASSSQINAALADRTNQALQSLAVTLIGFAALLVGGFSRFGLWRQVGLAIVLLIVVKSLDNLFTGQVKADPSMWPLQFVSTLGAVSAGYFLLWKSAHPKIARRKNKKIDPLQSPTKATKASGGPS